MDQALDIKYQNYCRQVEEYEGFYVSELPKECAVRGKISPFDPANRMAVSAAQFGLEKHSADNGIWLTLERIVRVNWQIVAGITFYITLQASDQHFYEVEVWMKIDRSHELIMFRIAQHYHEEE